MKYLNLTLAGLKKLANETYKKSGPGFRVFGLIGTLGSGKTTFTKAMAAVMKVKHAKSPTFTIINCYSGTKKSLYHVDLYRLEKEIELRALGLDEILSDLDNLVVIEWADKFPSIMKSCDALIKFEVLKNSKRNVTINAN